MFTKKLFKRKVERKKKHSKQTKKKIKKRIKKNKKNKKKHVWSEKYKKKINCTRPKGFSQKQHCRYGRVSLKAKATFKKKNNVSGYVLFEQLKDGVKVSYKILGLKTGKHGFHIHEKGNFKNDCLKAGPHFNPTGRNHSSRKSKHRHIGDLGNVVSKNMVAQGSFIDYKISLKNKNNILNRSVVVHDLHDDLGKGGNEESLRTGNAGARLNCAKILKI